VGKEILQMTGWKTWAAGIASMCSGVGLIITGILADPLDANMIAEGWGLVIAGLAIVGIGHKIEKSSK
jgi:hypothetical protein